MSNPGDQFLRIEGFMNPETIAEIRNVLDARGIHPHTVDELPARDRDARGRLLEEVPNAGLVVTKGVMVSFAGRWQTVRPKMQSRAANAFDALHRHVRYNHGDRDHVCDCCLRGGCGRQQPVYTYGIGKSVRYIEPTSLIAAYESGSIESIPIGPSPSSIGLGEAACYDLLCDYIDALSH